MFFNNSSWTKEADFSFDYRDYDMQMTDMERKASKRLHVHYKNTVTGVRIDLDGKAWDENHVLTLTASKELINKIKPTFKITSFAQSLESEETKITLYFTSKDNLSLEIFLKKIKPFIELDEDVTKAIYAAIDFQTPNANLHSSK